MSEREIYYGMFFTCEHEDIIKKYHGLLVPSGLLIPKNSALDLIEFMTELDCKLVRLKTMFVTVKGEDENGVLVTLSEAYSILNVRPRKNEEDLEQDISAHSSKPKVRKQE